MAEETIRAFKGKSSFNFRTEWKIFAWCFIIASILWLLTALNESYTSSITVKAKYINYPKDKVYIKPLPEDFKVMVTAKGWDLMSHYFRKNTEFITIDLNDYKKTDVMITRRLQDNFQQVMAQKIVIGEVFPETISMQKEEKGSKRVPIRLVQDFSYKKEFGLGGDISFSPDSVTVSGPVSVIKSIDHVDTDNAAMKDLDKTVTADLKLRDPELKNIAYSTYKIKVQIPVFQLTEQTAEVPVEVINKGSNGGLKLIPGRVYVIYQAPINKFSQIDSTQFQAVVDGSQIDTTAKQPLRVQLISEPKYTYNVRLKPDYIDYVLEK
jgi:YbbR domain-containing protein